MPVVSGPPFSCLFVSLCLYHPINPLSLSLHRRADGASTVRPYAGGIHRIANAGTRPAISVHLYGPRMGLFDGRDYDPSRDFVCDRLELEDLAPLTPMLPCLAS